MHKYFLTLGLILIAFTKLLAQSNFKPGYLIQLNGDTLYGEIDSRGYEELGIYCTFREDNRAQKRSIYPQDVFGFRIEENKFYVSKEIEGKSIFLEFLIQGEINLYYMRDELGEHYFIKKRDEPIVELYYDEKIIKQDGKHYLYQTQRHIKLLEDYTQEAPQLTQKIQQMEKPEYWPMIHLAEDYHNAVCEDSDCVIFQQELPFIKIDFELVGGINNWVSLAELNSPHYGLLTYVWLPRTNSNLYFKTGFRHLAPQNESDLNQLIIPIQLSYHFSGKILNPKFSMGFNYFLARNYLVPSAGAGLNIKLNRHLLLGLNYELNVQPVIGRRPETVSIIDFGIVLRL